MLPKVAIILINYKDYAKRYLSDCLASLRLQDYLGVHDLFIVDNESSAESFNYLKEMVPEAEIIRNEKNDGFAKGNNDAIKKVMTSNYDYVILFNMDTIVEKNCIRELVNVAQGDSSIGAVQAKLKLHPETELINSLGNTWHFLGFGYCLGYCQKDENEKSLIKKIAYPSGAAVLFNLSALKKVGLFDEHFWMYNEDQDLGWRLWLMGYSCVLAPLAATYHKYEFSKSISKYYFMDRNRILVILKNYRLATLLLIFPVFVIMELGLVIFAIKGGWFKEKLRVWKYFLNPTIWFYIFQYRSDLRNKRKLKDYQLADMISGCIWYQEIGDWKLKLVNPFMSFYWFVVRAVLKFFHI